MRSMELEDFKIYYLRTYYSTIQMDFFQGTDKLIKLTKERSGKCR